MDNQRKSGYMTDQQKEVLMWIEQYWTVKMEKIALSYHCAQPITYDIILR